jgi:hypothetical protein
LDDVWEEDANDMYDAREEFSRSMVAWTIYICFCKILRISFRILLL